MKSTIISLLFFCCIIGTSCQTNNKITEMQTIQFIPKEFQDVKLGYYETNANICTPHYPDYEFYLLNKIAINAPKKIIYTPSDSNFRPVIPVCGAYIITNKRSAKYAHLSAKMAHIRKIDEDIIYSGEIFNKNIENEYPALPPNHLKLERERAKFIEEAQNYSDEELDEGQASGSAININLMEYIDIPLETGIYEIWLSFFGLESNRMIVEVVFQK